jgi:hypothetical protein
MGDDERTKESVAKENGWISLLLEYAEDDGTLHQHSS